MIVHEVAGVLVASLMVLAFVSAIQPNSQMASILKASTSGWSTVLNSVRGSGPTSAVA